ncbi:helix-turn-helix domain-containing protein [Winogradskyella sp. SYSU M77433]|uniref:helix-turn-helix domain-containing protein n=1 Tax=Winogradskyella sp. SYSU M77433 TaxID=3042722 RepID=UPI00248089DD|nr:helix-turn-helix domain-containing protein [Winogradskyella sp. SYSU M77433]MDH7914146.1 helix-turn-helix domain-containing protein [Winogradskyella sp. SYSU M77433]
MTIKYYETSTIEHIVEELYSFAFAKKDLPFETPILPLCATHISYFFGSEHNCYLNNKKSILQGLMVSGQFTESYQIKVDGESQVFGMLLSPTSLYKLTKLDIYKIRNKHIPLIEFSESLFNTLNPVFEKYGNDMVKLNAEIKKVLASFELKMDKNVSQIDNVINYIGSKDGMLNTYELLDHVSFSQKTLETQFKKIVGITPGKYIRLHRFIKLMRKYERNKIDIKDLIYMYNYYDHSHFTKDFKHFMKQTPKEYFKSDYPFLTQYLKKLSLR